MPFYAVRKGRIPGVYLKWIECQSQIAGFKGAEFKKFATLEEAQEFMVPREEKSRASQFEIYTDGSSDQKTYATWAYAVYDNGQEVSSDSGSLPPPYTNSHGEVEAVLQALRFAKNLERGSVSLFSDSEFVVKTINVYSKTRKEKDWRGKAYVDEFFEILDIVEDRDVVVYHIDAHVGHAGNERADSLAREARYGGGSSREEIRDPSGYDVTSLFSADGIDFYFLPFGLSSPLRYPCLKELRFGGNCNRVNGAIRVLDPSLLGSPRKFDGSRYRLSTDVIPAEIEDCFYRNLIANETIVIDMSLAEAATIFQP
jgi:ribonuclease HI